MPPDIQTPSKLQSSLVVRTRFLLMRDKRSTNEVAAQADVPFYWLRKFRTGEIRSPGADKVQKLYEFLSHKKLVA